MMLHSGLLWGEEESGYSPGTNTCQEERKPDMLAVITFWYKPLAGALSISYFAFYLSLLIINSGAPSKVTEGLSPSFLIIT